MLNSSAQVRCVSRRDFLTSWFPLFFWRRHADLAGIRFDVLRHGQDRRRYLWIHGNEQTAREVLREHMRGTEGRAFLIRNNVRNVRLRGGELDPNRMFSREGAERNLRTLNRQWDFNQLQDALDELDRGRQKFLDKLLPERGELLIALHNNSAGYSVTDEIPISDRTSIRISERPREFALCTDTRDYEQLAAAPLNVVLQQAAPKEDDGSLSRLAAARRVRYVNIEAPLGSPAEQRRLLEIVERLPERYP
jgi:hypothetical protein